MLETVTELTFDDGDIWVGACADQKTWTVLLTNVLFAAEMMFSIVTKSKAWMAGFIIITENKINNSWHGISRLVHKNTERTSQVCFRIAEEIYELVIAVHSGHVERRENVEIWN